MRCFKPSWVCLFSISFSPAADLGEIIPDANPALPPSYHYQEYVFPEPDDALTCSGAENTSAVIEKVTLAQTHVMEPEWDFFYLISNRPALLQAVITGSGPSPEVSVEGFLSGASQGVLCLRGPADLAPSADADIPSFDDRFSVTLPKAWMQPGLSLAVTAGGDARTYTEADLNLGNAPEINLLMYPFDILDFNEGKEDVTAPESFLGDFASAMPAAVTRLGMFPGRIRLDSMIAADGANDEPVVLYTGADKKGVPNGNINAAALRFIDALKHGTGDYAFSFFYGNTENFNPGGWGGDKAFVGADFQGVFIHEMGHGLSLPHWGEGPYGRVAPNPWEYTYPYGGVGDNGGGRGERWNFYQNIQEFISPICEIPNHQRFGTERSDGMQRSNHCNEWRSDGEGPWDGFSDFSAFSMFRYLTGAAAPDTGTIPYRGRDMWYQMTTQDGFPTLKLDADGNRILERSHQVMETRNWETFDFKVPQQWNVPVYTVFGNYHPQYEQANILYQPVASLGNLPRIIDPTDPQTFEDLKAQRAGPWSDYFWWSKDITFKFTYADGSVLHALYPHGSVDRNWTPATHPWRWDILYWALNIPGGKKLDLIEMYHRPFAVRYSDSEYEGNIANPAYGITASNFMDGATFVKGIDVNIDPVGTKYGEWAEKRVTPAISWHRKDNGVAVTSLDAGSMVYVYTLSGTVKAVLKEHQGNVLWTPENSRGLFILKVSDGKGTRTARILLD